MEVGRVESVDRIQINRKNIHIPLNRVIINDKILILCDKTIWVGIYLGCGKGRNKNVDAFGTRNIGIDARCAQILSLLYMYLHSRGARGD